MIYVTYNSCQMYIFSLCTIILFLQAAACHSLIDLLPSTLARAIAHSKSYISFDITLQVALSMSNEAGLVAAADHLTALLLHHTSQAFIAVLSSSAYDESDQVGDIKIIIH